MKSRYAWILACTVFALAIDGYAKTSAYGSLAYFTVTLCSALCVFMHFRTVIPRTASCETVRFEKNLFIVSLNLLALLAAFKAVQPEFLVWLRMPADFKDLTPVKSTGLLTLFIVGVSMIVDKALGAIDATNSGIYRGPNHTVSTASAAFGGLLIVLIPLQFHSALPLVVPYAAFAWIGTCLFTGAKAEKIQLTAPALVTTTFCMLGALLLFGFPLLDLISAQGKRIPEMQPGELVDFVLSSFVWGYAACHLSYAVGESEIIRVGIRT